MVKGRRCCEIVGCERGRACGSGVSSECGSGVRVWREQDMDVGVDVGVV